eukprot:4217794-Pleurochrysis_carterae.AAC.2
MPASSHAFVSWMSASPPRDHRRLAHGGHLRNVRRDLAAKRLEVLEVLRHDAVVHVIAAAAATKRGVEQMGDREAREIEWASEAGRWKLGSGKRGEGGGLKEGLLSARKKVLLSTPASRQQHVGKQL